MRLNSHMNRSLTLYDIAIAGGGPAGTVAAILLARAGFRVGVATTLPKLDRIEGLSPRVLAILRANDLPVAGVAPATQRSARWGAFQGDQNVEHLVNRREFDRGLLERARSEGVSILEGTIASVQPDSSIIHMSDGREIFAGLLFEARGRRGPRMTVSRKAARTETIGPDTICIAGFVGQNSQSPPGSKIVAHAEGWLWQARLADGREWLQVAGDKSVIRNLRGTRARLERLWTHVMGEKAAAIEPPETLAVSAGNLRLNAPDLDPRCPRLGDAAVALDPLSGHGLFWAVSSALMAPPMAHALFGGQRDLAREFYRNRVVETFWRQARIGRDFYAASGQDGAFWRDRRAWPDSEPAHPADSTPRLEPRVLLRDGALGWGEVLVTHTDPGGAAFVLGQEIAPILRAIGERPIPDLQTFHRTYLPQLAPDTAARLHGWFISRGLGDGPAVHARKFDEENTSCEHTQAV